MTIIIISLIAIAASLIISYSVYFTIRGNQGLYEPDEEPVAVEAPYIEEKIISKKPIVKKKTTSKKPVVKKKTINKKK
jgi:hypothetical protein